MEIWMIVTLLHGLNLMGALIALDFVRSTKQKKQETAQADMLAATQT